MHPSPLYQGKTLPAPAVEFPYFPPVSSAKGEALLAAQRDTRGGPLVAHQLCALQVFQARITRSRYAFFTGAFFIVFPRILAYAECGD
jgi:hypothetical protein